MELELGLKLKRVADEFTSADFMFSKDRAGPFFISTETDTMFNLTAHLKGYRKQNIKIEINEDGSRIIIRGEKAIQETVMVGWKFYKKETEVRAFKKAFKIPDEVILDKIRAKFDDDESVLTISIPKKKKGIRGFIIEEVKEQEIAREGSGTLIVPDEVPKEENALQEKEAEYAEQSCLSDENSPEMPEIESVKEPEETGQNVANPEETQGAGVLNMEEKKMKEIQQDQNERLEKVSAGHEHDHVKRETIEEMKNFPDEGSGEATAEAPVVESHIATDEATESLKSGMRAEELEKKEISQNIKEKVEGENDQCQHLEQETDQDQHKNDQFDAKENDVQEGTPSSTREKKGRCKLCTPILAGSALLLSLVAFVIHFLRTKSQPGKRRD